MAMVTEQRRNLQKIGAAFASKVSPLGAQRLWILDGRDRIHIWVLTDEMEVERESAFYDVAASMCDEYPDAYIRLHIINPRTFSDATYRLSGIPGDAVVIKLPRR
jgi:hypothetical protein